MRFTPDQPTGAQLLKLQTLYLENYKGLSIEDRAQHRQLMAHLLAPVFIGVDQGDDELTEYMARAAASRECTDPR